MTVDRRRRRVLIVLPPRVHLLDAAGPIQAFASANDLGGDYEISTVADTATVTSHQGIELGASTTWPELSTRDLVMVVGGKLAADVAPLADHLVLRVAEHHRASGSVASVCAGALTLAQAGVLDGLCATTHHELLDRLARFRGVEVAHGVLYTCTPRVHTSAGIASGIDLSLHLIAHDHGPAFAARVARTLVVPAWRPGTAGQAPFTLMHRDHLDDLVHRAQDVLDQVDGPPPDLATLASTLHVGARTLVRHFVTATGMTPHAYSAQVRREAASELVAQGWTREAAARAIGYADARSLRERAR